MKNIILFLFLLMLYSCLSTNKVAISSTSNNNYLIKKITKKNSWYIVYAEKHDTLYKIISKVDNDIENCNKIVVGKWYDFELKSRRENIPTINGVKLKPMNYLDVKSSAYDKNGSECYLYDKETEICTEPKKGIFDLFYTDNLKGICYSK